MTEKSSSEKYTSDFAVLAAAGVGVIMTRTRETHRVEECLQNWAFGKDRKAFVWDVVNGWQERLADERLAPKPADKTLDLFMAMKKIRDIDGNGKNPLAESAVFVMQFPHWVLPNHPGAIALLKQYAMQLPTTTCRLVLVAPEGFVLPVELQNDIVVLDMELPDQTELTRRYNIVRESLEASTGNVIGFDEEGIRMLVASGSGMTEGEFETAVAQGIVENRDRMKEGTLEAEDVNAVVLRAKTDVVKRSEVLELMKVGSMEEIGGLDQAKDWIAKRRECFSEEAKEFGVDTPKGIACIGPPGTGKTIFAKAIAGSLQQPLIRFDVSKVFGSLVGQSEERVRAALKQIDAMAPCVVLIDEVDKAGIDPRQGGGDSGTSKRIMGNILTHMQETEAPVFWVLTANRVDGLPPELLRKGRLDEVFAVLPPNSEERSEVMRIHLRKRKQDADSIDDLDEAVEASSGFVSAEIEAAIKEAVIEAFHEDCEVSGELIAAQLQDMKPISVAFADDFVAMSRWAEQNARLASTPEDEGELSEVASGARPRKRNRQVEV